MKPKIKDQRKRIKMTQGELGKRINNTADYISKIERGVITPSAIVALKIAKELGVTVEHLWGGNISN